MSDEKKQDEKLPKYPILIGATFEALKQLNKPSTNREINNKVIEILELRGEQVKAEQVFNGAYGQKMTRLEVYLGFCRTWLKNYGAFENNKRQWSISSNFESIDSLTPDECELIYSDYRSKNSDAEIIVPFSNEEVLGRFDKYFNFYSDDKKNSENNILKPRLHEFLDKYADPNVILNLSLDQFCYGVNRFTYCFQVGPYLPFGTFVFSQGYWKLYNIYFDGKNKTYVAKEPGKATATSDKSIVNDVFEKTKHSIVNLINSIPDIHGGNFSSAIAASQDLNNLLASKILFVYDSENFIPIYSLDHLSKFVYALGLPYNPKASFVENQAMIGDYFKKNIKPHYSDATQFIFMEFLYNNDSGIGLFDTTKKLIPVNPITAVSTPSNVPNNLVQNGEPINLEIRLYNAKAKQKKSKNKFEENGNEETEKTDKVKIITGGDLEKEKLIGNKGEDLVLKQLEKEMIFLGDKIVGPINKRSGINDTLGYDIDFMLENGTKIYVDVKSSENDHKGNASFFISSGEYEKMKEITLVEHSSYYILYLDNVFHPNGIKAIRSSDIIGNAVPTTYSVSLQENIAPNIKD